MTAGARLSLLLGLLALAGCDGASADPDAGAPVPGDLRPLDGALGPVVLGVFGTAADDVWFVGGLLAPGARGRFIAHFDGREVRAEAVPDGPALWWVFGDGAGRVRAAGEEGQILVREADVWREEQTGLDEKAVLWGLWGAAPDDLWAVGGSVRRGGPKGVVLRSAGDGAWRRVDDPALPDDLNLYKVWGRAPGDVHLVGEGGVTVRWDGETFTRHVAPVPDLLFTVHGRAAGPVLAVGGLDEGRVVRWTGEAWVDDGLTGAAPLNGVFVHADGTARAVGATGAVFDRDRDGTWRAVRAERALAPFTLHAVWGATPGETWAVGGDLNAGRGGLIATARRPLPPVVVETP